MNVVIQLERVTRTYALGATTVQALRGVSLQIRSGEFVAILGASGSGKSTLMNLIGCLDRPTAGHYFLDGVDVAKLDHDQLADIRNEKIGFVFQSFNLLTRTSALQNVELPALYSSSRISASLRRNRAREALELVGLAGRAHHHPNQLSGGEQQRVAIARAIANQPSVLLADEPTGNLDSRTSAEIMTVFQSLNQRGITIVMVTHELDIARFAKRNVFMRDGLVRKDELVAAPLDSRAELARWNQAEQTEPQLVLTP
ncbi:MAG: ABC transporter ATP-binding protein [Verrucomicrobia bacterium]|nr:MAG: ABC transporter ATP-binding protein [Verrucomicrobiota bacterium]